MCYRQMAEEFFAAFVNRPHGTWRPRTKSAEVNSSDPARGEFPVLRYIHESGGAVMPSRISQERQLSSARIANILSSLERKGLICRQTAEDDRRKVLVSLTAFGEQQMEAKRQEALDDSEWLLRQMGEEDARELIRLEWKMTEIIRREYERRG